MAQIKTEDSSVVKPKLELVTKVFTKYEVKPDFLPLMKGCGFVRDTIKKKGMVSELNWQQFVSVVDKTSGGAKIISTMSQNHDDLGKVFPSKCKIIGETSDACKSCQFNGKIKTPLDVIDQIENEGKPWRTIKVPGYFVNKTGVYKNDQSDYPDEMEIVSSAPIWIKETWSSFEKQENAITDWKIEFIDATGNPGEASLGATHMSDSKELTRLLHQNKLNTSVPDDKALLKYLKAAAGANMKQKQSVEFYTQMGWSGNDFILAGDKITKDGIEKINLAIEGYPKKAMERILDSRHGTAQGWIDGVLKPLSDNPNYYPHLFIILSALSSPLLKLYDVKGSIICASGESGMGKTMSTAAAVATFFNPLAMSFSGGESTVKGIFKGMHEDFPIVIDDITDNKKFDVGKLLISSTTETQNLSATRNRTLRSDEILNSGLIYITTNTPLQDLPNSILKTAHRKRYLELLMREDLGSRIDDEFGKNIRQSIKENYGSFGFEFMKLVVKHKDQMFERIDQECRTLVTKYNLSGDERYVKWRIAGTIAACKLAEENGLLKSIDWKSACEFAVTTAIGRVQTMGTEMQQVDEFFNNMIVSCHNRIMTLDGDNRFIRDPIGAYKKQHMQDYLFLGSAALAKICNDEGMPFNQVKGYIKKTLKSFSSKQRISSINDTSFSEIGVVSGYMIPLKNAPGALLKKVENSDESVFDKI